MEFGDQLIIWGQRQFRPKRSDPGHLGSAGSLELVDVKSLRHPIWVVASLAYRPTALVWRR